MSSRETILARIRAASAGPRLSTPDGASAAGGPGFDGCLAHAAPDGVSAAGDHLSGLDGVPGSDASGAGGVELLAERLRDYGARVHFAAPGEVGEVVAAVLRARGVGRVGVADGIPPEWLGGLDCVREPDVAELDTLDGVVTGSALAIAETGTIVLDGGPGQGRRALTLVPDYHLCVITRIVATVPEAVAAVSPTRPLTWVSGPSATSDIELSRVEGVHGPRTLEVVIVRS